MLLSMLQVLFAEGRVAPGALTGFIDGIEAIGELVRPFTPESTATATGIDADALRHLTRDFAASPSAVCYGRMGVSTQRFGALCQWLIQLLNILTGNLDRVGGAMFTRPAFDMVGLGGAFGQPGSFGKRRTRVRGLPEFGSEFPVSALAEEILTPGKGRIRALVTSAGNPVLSTPNGRRLEEALAQLDFMVSIDPYLNETTRHAHFILPPTSGLERDHFDLVFHVLAVRNTVKYSKALFDKPPGALHDWEILHRLTERIGEADPARRPGWSARLMSRWLTPKRSVALGIRLSGRGAEPVLARTHALQDRRAAAWHRSRTARALSAATPEDPDPAHRPRAGAARGRSAAAVAGVAVGRDGGRVGCRIRRRVRGGCDAPDRSPRSAYQQLLAPQLAALRERPAALHPADASGRCRGARSDGGRCRDRHLALGQRRHRGGAER
jgi:anaerobic selenocysteine-containing dehydrogenase